MRSGDQWVLEIPGEDIKTKRPLEFPVSARLSAMINFYVNEIRSQISGADRHDYLWASSRGRGMHDEPIARAVGQRTRKVLGFPVNLHRF